MAHQFPPSLQRRTLLTRLAALCGLGLSGCIPHSRSYYLARSGPPRRADGKIVPTIGTYDLSPGGRVIAFDTYVNPGRSNSPGLYDWSTGTLTRLPTLPGFDLSSPSFSSDGTRIALVANPVSRTDSSIIAMFDVRTSHYTLLPEAHLNLPHDLRRGRIWSVIFQPGTDRILYSHSKWTGLSMIGLADRKVTTILPQENGFLDIGGLTFAGPNEIWFEAIGPRLPRLKTSLVSGVPYLFSLPLGSEPDILFPQFNHLPDMVAGAGYTSVAVASDFKTIVALGLNRDAPSSWGHGYNWEIFRLTRDCQATQLTNLRGYLQSTAISHDGSTACFGASPTYGAPQDLFLLDLASNRVTPTHLLNAIQHDPDFDTVTPVPPVKL
jgi:hypothetical protein